MIPRPPDAPIASKKIESQKPSILFSLEPSNLFNLVSCIKIISELKLFRYCLISLFLLGALKPLAFHVVIYMMPWEGTSPSPYLEAHQFFSVPYLIYHSLITPSMFSYLFFL